MQYYTELTLLPCSEIPLHFLWEKVYQQIHLALVEHSFDSDEIIKDKSGMEKKLKKSHIGVSFPQYNIESFQLGQKLRLFSSSKDILLACDLQSYLSRLSDYVHMTSIRPVPDKVEGYACFKRIQVKTNHERLARRRAKRINVSLEEARKVFDGKKEVYSRAPYIFLKSLSSNEKFRLMIVKTEYTAPTSNTGFSTYGLSATLTIPIF